MCSVIVANGGTLDKFIGDCIMAIWNAPKSLPHHERAACQAAVHMQSALMALCESWAEEGVPEIRFRIGLNTSRVMLGNYGCEFRVNYTVLGDGVNLAARLEAANKEFGTVVLVAENTYHRAADLFVFRKMGKLRVPGKAEPTAVFELLCEQGVVSGVPEAYTTFTADECVQALRAIPGAPDLLFHWQWVHKEAVVAVKSLFEKGVERYQSGDTKAALKWFTEARAVLPADKACRVLAELCASSTGSPGGVIEVLTK
eukprot:RCo052343